MKNPSTETARQRLNDLTGKVIGWCIEIHCELGPGFANGCPLRRVSPDLATGAHKKCKRILFVHFDYGRNLITELKL